MGIFCPDCIVCLGIVADLQHLDGGSFLYSDYLERASAASGANGIIVGSFVVNVPDSVLWADGKRIAAKVGNAIDALPLQHWLMEYYLEDDADISSRWRQAAARTDWS